MRQRFARINWWRLTWAIFASCVAIPLMLIAYDTASYENLFSVVVFVFVSMVCLGVVISLIIRSLPRWSYLEVDEFGFKIKIGRGLVDYDWDQCSRFFRVELARYPIFGKKERVACNLKSPGKSEEVLKLVSGAHVVLLEDYGINPADLVEIMNEYRDRAKN